MLEKKSLKQAATGLFIMGGDRAGLIPGIIIAHVKEKLGFFQEGLCYAGGDSAGTLNTSVLLAPGFGDRSRKIFHYDATELPNIYADLLPPILKGSKDEDQRLQDLFNSSADYSVEQKLSAIQRGGRRNPAILYYHMNKLLNGARLGDLVLPTTITAQGISHQDSLVLTNHPDDRPRFQTFQPQMQAAYANTVSCAHPLLYPAIPVELWNSNIGTSQIDCIDGGFVGSVQMAEAAMSAWFPTQPHKIILLDCGYVTQTYTAEEYNSLLKKSAIGNAWSLWNSSHIMFSMIREYAYAQQKSNILHLEDRMKIRNDGSELLSITFNLREHIEDQGRDSKWIDNPTIVTDDVINGLKSVGESVTEEFTKNGRIDAICEALTLGRQGNVMRMNAGMLYPQQLYCVNDL